MIENGTEMEFHVGTSLDFQDHLNRTGGKVLGQVKTMARNYNPIFQVQYPGESSYRLAFTQISGKDRLQSLVDQVAVVRWKGQAVTDKIKAVHVFGDTADRFAAGELRLLHQYRSLPTPDYVVIGQKGGFERSFRTAGKANALIQLNAVAPEALKGVLLPPQYKKLITASTSKNLFTTFADASLWDDMYERATPLLTSNQIPPLANFTSLRIANASHDVSDLLLTDESGQTKRVRLISATWGDEIKPIAKAIVASSPNAPVLYIGTAGAFPGNGIRVGDLIAPSTVLTTSFANVPMKGWAGPLPDIAKKNFTVTHVTSPMNETEAWMAAEMKRAQMVEVETAYLAEIFANAPNPVQILLLVSDVISSAETLATADSSARVKALNAALALLFKTARATIPAAVPDTAGAPLMRLAQATGLGDAAFAYHVRSLARKQGVTDPAQMKALVPSNKTFSTVALEKNLTNAGITLDTLLAGLKVDATKFQVYVDGKLLDGTFNPKLQPLNVYVQSTDPIVAGQLDAAIKSANAANPALAKSLVLKSGTAGPMDSSLVLVADSLRPFDREMFLWDYADAALTNAGLVGTLNDQGTLTLTPVPMRDPDAAPLSPLELSAQAFSLRCERAMSLGNP